MYEATIFDGCMERMHTVVARTAREAVTLAWRANLQDQLGEGRIATFEPDDLRVTSLSDETFKNLLLVVDRGRMTVAVGTVRRVS